MSEDLGSPTSLRDGPVATTVCRDIPIQYLPAHTVARPEFSVATLPHTRDRGSLVWHPKYFPPSFAPIPFHFQRAIGDLGPLTSLSLANGGGGFNDGDVEWRIVPVRPQF